jgi:GNAT superfamily N-acetyltransferase
MLLRGRRDVERSDEGPRCLIAAGRRRRVLPRFLLSDLHDAARCGHLYAASRDGVIVGAAALLPPGAYPVSLWRQVAQVIDLAPALPWALGAAGEALKGRRRSAGRHRQFPSHYFVMALGTDPAAQGTGCGTALLAPVLQRADEEHAPCFLFTATAANTSWYGRFGFSVAAEYQPTDTWPTMWAMWREPTSERVGRQEA